MTRPKPNQITFIVRLDQKLFAKLNEHCKRRGYVRNSFVERSILELLDFETNIFHKLDKQKIGGN